MRGGSVGNLLCASMLVMVFWTLPTYLSLHHGHHSTVFFFGTCSLPRTRFLSAQGDLDFSSTGPSQQTAITSTCANDRTAFIDAEQRVYCRTSVADQYSNTIRRLTQV